MDPIVQSPQFSSLYLNPENDRQKQIIDFLWDISSLHQEQPTCYELQIKSKLCVLWAALYQEIQLMQGKSPSSSKSVPRLKEALNYIHSNYRENLTLEDIASACNISKSEVCRFFKRMMRQTCFEYLLRYRIQKSIPLLLGNVQNITEISEAVGFSNSSYYAEIFRRYMLCSPTEYRKKSMYP